MSALQYVDVPGYNALIIRKTYSQLSQPGALIADAHLWLDETDAKWNNSLHQWKFPSGATLSFGYMDSYFDRFRYQGAAWQCVAKGTLVKLADGTTCRVESLQVGMTVSTLDGPKKITRLFPPRVTSCVAYVGPWGSQICPETHCVLSSPGWLSYTAARHTEWTVPIPRLAGCTQSQSGFEKSPLQLQSGALTSEDRKQPLTQQQLRQDRRPSSESAASSTDGQSGCRESSDDNLEASQLPWSCVPLVLHVPASPSGVTQFYSHLLRSAELGGLLASSTPDSPGGCQPYRGFCGEQFLRQATDDRSSRPLSADADVPSRLNLPWGSLGSAPADSQTDAFVQIHPYTKAQKASRENVELWPCFVTPVGERTVYDLTVEDANHYITLGGFVNQNCICVDEAVQLEESAYRYLASRIRKPVCPLHHKSGFDPECRTCKSVYALSKVPTRLRAASNPPALGQGEWVKERFRVKEVDGIYRGTHPTRAFIPSLLTDNQGLDQEDYAARLEELDPVTRAQLLKGDWSIKTEGRFKPSWFKGRTWSRSTQDTWLVGSEGLTRRSSNPEDPDYLTGRFVGLNAAVKRDSNRKFPEVYHTGELFFFIMTDPAATQKEGPGDADIWLRKAPAWTAFGCFALTPRNDLLILDFVRFQKEIPDVIRGLHGFVRRCVRKGRTPQFIGVEANGVGKGVFQQLQRDGLPVVDCTRHTHDKFIYATPAMNRAAYGQIYLPAPDMPDCEWMEAFQSELFSYVGHPNLDVCDQIDVLAHACQFAHTRAVMSEQQQPATGDLDDMIGVF